MTLTFQASWYKNKIVFRVNPKSTLFQRWIWSMNQRWQIDVESTWISRWPTSRRYFNIYQRWINVECLLGKEYYCIIPGTYVNLYENTYFVRLLWICSPVIIQITPISHIKGKYFNRAPNFIQWAPTLCYPELLKFAGKNTPRNTFFTEYLPVAALKCQFSF